MLRNLTVEVEGSDPDLYEVTASVPLPELKCGDTGHTYVLLTIAEGNAAEPAAFTCELKFQVKHGRNVERCVLLRCFFYRCPYVLEVLWRVCFRVGRTHA